MSFLSAQTQGSCSFCLLGLVVCIAFACCGGLLHILTAFNEQFNLKQFCSSQWVSEMKGLGSESPNSWRYHRNVCSILYNCRGTLHLHPHTPWGGGNAAKVCKSEQCWKVCAAVWRGHENRKEKQAGRWEKYYSFAYAVAGTKVVKVNEECFESSSG